LPSIVPTTSRGRLPLPGLQERFGLIVFDLDGTLVDSRRDIADSANCTLVEYGAAPLAEEEIGRMVGDGAPTLVARAFRAAGLERPRDALERFLAIYAGRLLQHTKPYPGMVETLEQLDTRVSLAVLTNKPVAATRRILEGLDLARYFKDDCVVGGDGAFPRKPDPAGLQHLMSLCGVDASATVMVGDSVNDWRVARGASAKACLARYGFGWEGFPTGELSADDWIIDRPADLLAFF
jgi:phosphoglycolate phosphatase